MKVEKTLGHGEFMRKTSRNGSAPPSRIQSPSPAVAAAAAAYMAPSASDYPSSIGPPSYAVQQFAVPKGDVHVARSNTHTHADERWARVKIILGLTSISAAIATVSLASILAAEVSRSNSIAQFIVPPSLATLVWNIAELGRILLARGEGIVPGAHVGVRLVLWCAWLAVAIAFPLRNQVGNRSYDTWGYYTSWDTLSLVIAYMIVTLCATVVFLEFALFARACVEENRRLKQKKATNAILHKAAALYAP